MATQTTRSSTNTRKKRKGSNGGGFIPAGGTYIPKRADHGRDLITDPGGPLIAPGDGYVVRIGNDPGGFGPSYPVVHFRTGPYAGRTMYLGHTNTALQAGASFKAGAVLSYTGTTGVGSATTPGWAEIGFGIPGTRTYGVGGPPFGGSATTGSLQSSAPVSTGPTASPDTSVQTTVPTAAPPPNAPPIITPPTPQLPGSTQVALPKDLAEAWKMIAAQPLSSPEARRWAELMGGNSAA